MAINSFVAGLYRRAAFSGGAGDKTIASGSAVVGYVKMLGNAADLAGAVTIKDGATVVDVIPAGTVAGTAPAFLVLGGLLFTTQPIINFADAGDVGKIYVAYRDA